MHYPGSNLKMQKLAGVPLRVFAIRLGREL